MLTHNKRLTRISLALLLASLAMLLPLSVAFAVSPGGGGQPNQSCQNYNPPITPGFSASAPGSAFNTSGVAGGVYAGTQPQNKKNPNSVSQYDVACFQLASH